MAAGSLGLSNVHVSPHPLIHSKLSLLRSANAIAPVVRSLVKDVSSMLCYEATSQCFKPKALGQGISPMNVPYPVQSVEPSRIALVPVLRSGLAMVDPFLSVLPQDTIVHHLGIFRDKSTLSPVEYYNKLSPPSLKGPIDTAFVVDPIIATGGTAEIVIQILRYTIKQLKKGMGSQAYYLLLYTC